jgi:hypothetical protein
MSGFHDLLRQKPLYLFMSSGWSSISTVSLMGCPSSWILWKSCWCLGLDAMSQVDDVPRHVGFHAGVNGMSCLSDADVIALTGDVVQARRLQS